MRQHGCSLSRDRGGSISVELALIASLILLPMTLGAVDAAQLVFARGRLDQVVHQAFFYAYANYGAVTGPAVQTAAASSYGTGTVPAVTATVTKYCITPATGYPPTGTPSQPNSNGSCASASQVVESYLSVNASISVTLPFSVAWIAQTITLSASGTARVA
jgi:hypothetical protein